MWCGLGACWWTCFILSLGEEKERKRKEKGKKEKKEKKRERKRKEVIKVSPLFIVTTKEVEAQGGLEIKLELLA
jgi:3'-phosphoadenosine 5'-phosphosulfate sulfotransferase (PAPS reductase)/FAD synthetase